jgi:hypothetical protein
MLDLWKKLAPNHAAATQLISHDHARYVLQIFQQMSEKPLRGHAITPWLNVDVEHEAFLIDRAPEIAQHALDRSRRAVAGGGAIARQSSQRTSCTRASHRRP